MERYFVFWRTVVSSRRAYAESNPYPGEDEIYYFNNIAFPVIQVHVYTHIRATTPPAYQCSPTSIQPLSDRRQRFRVFGSSCTRCLLVTMYMRAGVSLAAKRKSGNNRGNLFPVGTESSIANLTAQHDAPRCSLPARAIIFLRCETTSRHTSTDELHGMSECMCFKSLTRTVRSV